MLGVVEKQQYFTNCFNHYIKTSKQNRQQLRTAPGVTGNRGYDSQRITKTGQQQIRWVSTLAQTFRYGQSLAEQHASYSGRSASVSYLHVNPFITTVDPFPDGYCQQDNVQTSNHLKLVFFRMTVSSQCSQQPPYSQWTSTPVGCGGAEDLHFKWLVDKSVMTVWCHHVRKLVMNVSETLLDHLVDGS